MTDTELAQRLERLEQDNRRMRRIGVIAVLIAAALGLMAATRTVPDVIKAHQFDAVDGSGNVRVMMSGALNNTPGIAVSDAQGNPRAMMTVSPSGSPSFSLLDGQGKPRAQMALNASDAPNLVLYDGSGNKRAALYVNSKVGASFVLVPLMSPTAKTAGRASVALVASNAGFAGLGLSDFYGNEGASMSLDASGSPSVSVMEPWGLGIVIGRKNVNGGAQPSGITIFLHNDNEHRVIWHEPEIGSRQ